MKPICGIILLLTLSTTAHGALVNYTGVVSDLPTGSLAGSVFESLEVGDLIAGSFNYSSLDSTDSKDWDAVGRYYFNSTNSSFSIRTLDVSMNNDVIFDLEGHISSILIENDWQYTPNPSLYPTIDAYTPIATLENGSEVFIRLQNRDTNIDLINSDMLPEYPMSIDNYNYVSGSITLPFQFGQIEFTPTSVSAVPLPGSLTLLLGGIGMLSLLGGKRRDSLKILIQGKALSELKRHAELMVDSFIPLKVAPSYSFFFFLSNGLRTAFGPLLRTCVYI